MANGFGPALMRAMAASRDSTRTGRIGPEISSAITIDDAVADNLASHYGTLALDLAGLIQADPSLGKLIHPDGTDVWAQVIFARDREWVCTANDVLRRRTTVTVRGLDTAAIRTQVEDPRRPTTKTA
jgi:glycerol-3-phosphate dehydrogenase